MNFEPLKDFLDYYLPMLGVPGSDTVIYKGRDEVFRYTAGFDNKALGTPVRRDALYNIYSCTKISTCIAAMQLIERGEIVITDPVYAYFPEYRNLKVKSVLEDGTVEIRDAKKPMLIKHLFTMTSGLDYNLSRPGILRVKERTDGRCPTLDIVKALAEDPLDFEPGEQYKYSLSHDVLGGIIELVSGMKLSEYMKENIFDPLGMKNTFFGFKEERRHDMATMYQYDLATKTSKEIPVDNVEYTFGSEYESGGAGLISCVDDYILLADALTHLGLGKSGNRILSESAVNLMRKNQLTPSQLEQFRNAARFLGYGYGFGMRTNMSPEDAGNLCTVGQFGWDGARLCYLSADPEKRISVFHAEHMGGLHSVVIPRLRNLVYSCLEY